ncbi:aminoacyl-histidine dipeptidase [Lutimonas sp.]|uniref:aminoacyl-histidine dipeptidase n=1 Tax=Lutimonas sp. TaxID=1872403 RepID=UPI003D9B4E43
MENVTVRSQEPTIVWNHFADINAIPRASKKEEEIVAFMVAFGKKLGLETIVDPVSNVIIRKPATPGMESRKSVVLQSHLDMVHQKNADVNFDFATEGINMKVDGDWVKAAGTTLGADNGLGVAAIMSVLSSNDLEHPAIEALFTIDEETGMTGAQGLEAGYLTGDILLNLDTEEDDEIDIGCAGGIDVTASKSYAELIVEDDCLGFRISVKGLQGGHSGMDIHKGLGNANKIMNQLLKSNLDIIKLSQIDGGSLRNAIPRESVALLSCLEENIQQLKENFETTRDIILKEFATTEPNLSCELLEVERPLTCMSVEDQTALINALENAVNGVYSMSPGIPDLVESSNNIARVNVGNKDMHIASLTRSSVEKSKMEVANALKETFETNGFEVQFSGSYPGWSPNRDSPILKVLTSIYSDLFKSEPAVVACHAGLECGLLGTHYPDMDMISFGPTIKGAHSPDERASISSTQRFWTFLQLILKNIPEKQSS